MQVNVSTDCCQATEMYGSAASSHCQRQVTASTHCREAAELPLQGGLSIARCTGLQQAAARLQRWVLHTLTLSTMTRGPLTPPMVR